MPREENPDPGTAVHHAPAAVPPEKRAAVERPAREIQDAVAAEIDELAANLVTTDDAHLFGANEFKVRALAHRIAAKAIERHLTQKNQQTRRVPLGSRAPACMSAGSGRAGYKKNGYPDRPWPDEDAPDYAGAVPRSEQGQAGGSGESDPAGAHRARGPTA